MAVENQIQAVLVITKNGISGNSRSVTLTGSIENGSNITQDLVFSPAQISIQVSVPLVDDAIALEEPIQYLFYLQIPTGQTGVKLGEHPSCTLVVEDDDGKTGSVL